MSNALDEMIQVARWQQTHKRMTRNAITNIQKKHTQVIRNLDMWQQAVLTRNPLNILVASTGLKLTIDDVAAQLSFLLALVAVLNEAQTDTLQPGNSGTEADEFIPEPEAEMAVVGNDEPELVTEEAETWMDPDDLRELDTQDEGRGEPEQEDPLDV